MNEQELLQEIMIGLLLAGIYLGVLRAVYRKSAVRQAMPAVAGILLILFGMLTATLWVFSRVLGIEIILLAVLIMISFLIVVGAAFYLIRHFRNLNLGIAAILLLYLVIVGCVTVFTRNTSGDHSASLLRMDVLERALQMHSAEPVRHILENIALFVPLGVLLPYMDEENLNDVTYALMLSLSLSVLIESAQLLLNLGQADLTDIVANVLGGGIGYLLYQLLRRLGLSAEEDDA